jgi:hypothetical protein
MNEQQMAEEAKKARFDHLETLEGLIAAEFVDIRKCNLYAPARTSRDKFFHQREQELIMKELFATLQKSLV